MEHLLACMKIIGDDTIQRTQLRHRLQLIEAFQIEKNMKILEIGCGQGDTTVALADAVGKDGHILAIDIASPDYGAPITLGEAAQTISTSPIGTCITFQFETDFLAFETDETFDVAVLSHCSWYFKHPEVLAAYFVKLQKIAKRICFAEWDLDFKQVQQRAHFCAANILALHAAFFETDGNIQNLFHKAQIQQLLMDSGFTIEHTQIVDATYLQDGMWEVDYSNEIVADFKNTPPKIQTLVESYKQLMNVDTHEVLSLNSFVICAKA